MPDTATPVDQLTPGWPDHYLVHYLVTREAIDRFVALNEEFDVVGMGSTPVEAINQAQEMLDDYLNLVKADGGTFEDALRPVPRRVVWKFYALLHIQRTLSRILRRPPRRGPSDTRTAEASFGGPAAARC